MRAVTQVVAVGLFFAFFTLSCDERPSAGPASPVPARDGEHLVVKVSQLGENPGLYNGKKIRLDGKFVHGFEQGDLERIWVVAPFECRTLEKNPGASDSHEVRVWGTFHAEQGRRYGHLGAYWAEIRGDRMEER